MLIGHPEQRQIFLDALHRGRMHHAWLLSGPKGIGKRRFADWAARTLLSGASAPEGAAAGEIGDEIGGEAGGKAARLLDAGAHPDHRLLLPPEEGRGSATGSIIVDQVRALAEFLHSHPAIAPWRTLLVDSIDDMNPNTANAFLKELEEPGERTVFLLVSHAPARLLPTIRSRCRTLRLFPLADGEVRSVLLQADPGLKEADVDALVRLAAGTPGSVQEFGAENLVALENELGRIEKGTDPLPFVRGFQPQSALPKFRALLALVPRNIAARARQRGDVRLADLHGQAESLARDAIRLAYDRQQVAMALASITARMGQIQGLR